MSSDIPIILKVIGGEAYEGLGEGDEGGEDAGGNAGGKGKEAGGFGFRCELLG